MKRIITALFACCMTVLVGYGLAACKDEEVCQHTYDNACDAICNECEEERSVVHAWQNADCDTPKTCTVCGATEGEPKGHTWKDPDCDNPKTCSVCGIMEGVANGHAYTIPSYNDHYHFLACENCGKPDETAKEKHVLDENYACNCGCAFDVEISSGWETDDGLHVALSNKDGDKVKEFFYYGDVLLSYTDYYYENGNLVRSEQYLGDDTLETIYIYERNENGDATKCERYFGDGTLDYYYINTYDGENLIETVFYLGDGSVDESIQYEYDEMGNCIREESFSSEGVSQGVVVSAYNENGEETLYERYTAEGVLEYGCYNEFDEQGVCVKSTCVYEDGTKDVSYYNENGNCFLWEYFNSEGEKETSVAREYNEEGTCISELNIYSDGSKIVYNYDANGNETMYEYYENEALLEGTYSWYDEEGNLIKQKTVDSNGLSVTYYYNANGEIIREEAHDGNGKMYSCAQYERDEYDRVIKEEYFDGDGVLCETYKYAYDENDLLIRMDYYGADGNLNHYYVYEYNENELVTKSLLYESDGTLSMYWEIEYDDEGEMLKTLFVGLDAGEMILYEYDDGVEYRSHYVNSFDKDCETAIVCDECGEYVFVAAKEHNFGGPTQEGDDGEYHVCQNEYCEVTDLEYNQRNRITAVSITIDGVEYTKDNTSADNPAVIKSDSVVVITVYGVDVGNEDLICKLEYRSGADNPIHENWLWVFNEDNTQATWTTSGEYFISQTTVFELRYSTYMYNYKPSGVYIIYEAGDSR